MNPSAGPERGISADTRSTSPPMATSQPEQPGRRGAGASALAQQRSTSTCQDGGDIDGLQSCRRPQGIGGGQLADDKQAERVDE